MPAPASASTLTTVETAHEDMVVRAVSWRTWTALMMVDEQHDCQLDWYGKRLATCSSDRTVKLFDVDSDGNYTLLDTLRGHEGPVWALAWGHPKFGSILASSSYDGKVFVWREVAAGQAQRPGVGGSAHGRWEKIKEHALHGASVNAIAWAPHELGPILACASSDGKISVLAFANDGTWDASLIAAHSIGVNSISWAPSVVPSSLITPSQPTAPGQAGQSQQQAQPQYVKKLATGGCDNLVKIWNYNTSSNQWAVEEVLEGHTDWIRDVAFAPGIGLPRTYLASASQDRTVSIWTQDAPGQAWTRKVLNPAPYLTTATGPGAQPAQEGKFPDAVWKVSWSVTGNVLAVSAGDGKVSLWKENLKGEWECVSEVNA